MPSMAYCSNLATPLDERFPTVSSRYLRTSDVTARAAIIAMPITRTKRMMSRGVMLPMMGSSSHVTMKDRKPKHEIKISVGCGHR